MLPHTYNIDHITPWAMTKNNNIENLQALCPNCHALKTVKDRQKITKWKKVIVPVLTCECKPGFNWKTLTTFKKHKTSKRHLALDQGKQDVNYRKIITDLQNKNIQLEVELDHWKKMYLNR
jgi:hypothetical protein